MRLLNVNVVIITWVSALSWITALPLPQSINGNDSPSECSQQIIRKEWRQLDSHEQSEFFRGIQLLMNNQSSSSESMLDHYSRQHLDNAQFAHNAPVFFPWHRYFVRQVELEMQRVLGNTSFAMPYWDWTLDSQAPEQSPLLTNTSFGTVGRTVCVEDGAFANARRHVPTTGCIQRTTDSVLGAFYSREQIQSIMIQSQDYDTFRRDMEDLPHAVVHFGIGGDMATMYSTNDPLFYLHHSQMDRLWAEWQQSDPRRLIEYTGTHPQTGSNVNQQDVMVPFQVTVSSVMDSRRLCYSYSTTTTTTTGETDALMKESLSSFSSTPLSSEDMLLDPFDRSLDTQSLLRMAQPLPLDWMQARHMNVTFVRQREQELAQVNFRINQHKRLLSGLQ